MKAALLVFAVTAWPVGGKIAEDPPPGHRPVPADTLTPGRLRERLLGVLRGLDGRNPRALAELARRYSGIDVARHRVWIDVDRLVAEMERTK